MDFFTFIVGLICGGVIGVLSGVLGFAYYAGRKIMKSQEKKTGVIKGYG